MPWLLFFLHTQIFLPERVGSDPLICIDQGIVLFFASLLAELYPLCIL